VKGGRSVPDGAATARGHEVERKDAGTGDAPRLRAFVGIPLPGQLAAEYLAAQRALAALRDVKWVEPANLHLTLKFLGQVPRASVPLLGQALERAAARGQPAVLEPGRLTAFPNDRAARVIVVELADASGAVGRLQADVERELAALGHPPEDRAFRTHVTLGRLRGGTTDARAALAAAGAPRGVWRVEAFALVESRLGPKGPSYSELGAYRLGT
jgi:2'-5' RNA ligase